MFGSKIKDQKWLEITVYQKKYTIKHFILYILALKGPNLLSNTYFGKFLFTLDSTQCVECVELIMLRRTLRQIWPLTVQKLRGDLFYLKFNMPFFLLKLLVVHFHVS